MLFAFSDFYRLGHLEPRHFKPSVFGILSLIPHDIVGTKLQTLEELSASVQSIENAIVHMCRDMYIHRYLFGRATVG